MPSPHRLNFENRILLLALVAGLPGALSTALLLWLGSRAREASADGEARNDEEGGPMVPRAVAYGRKGPSRVQIPPSPPNVKARNAGLLR